MCIHTNIAHRLRFCFVIQTNIILMYVKPIYIYWWEKEHFLFSFYSWNDFSLCGNFAFALSAVLRFRKFTFYFSGYFCYYNFILYPPFPVGSLPGRVLKLACIIFLFLPFPLNGMILVNNILQLSFAQSNVIIHRLIYHLLTLICYGWEAISKSTLGLPLPLCLQVIPYTLYSVTVPMLVFF